MNSRRISGRRLFRREGSDDRKCVFCSQASQRGAEERGKKATSGTLCAGGEGEIAISERP